MALAPMKARAQKVMKAKRTARVATGRFARALVLRGSKTKTVGGLKSEDLMKSKRGKIVSKRASANGKRRYRQIEQWVGAHMAARQALHMRGFVPINGKTIQGKALYVKTKAILAGRSQAPALTSASVSSPNSKDAQSAPSDV